ncbi:MAG TPA: DinB family protein [Gemmatimonadaceae bacterium]|nr:DinB family protein [Gemmatimonadaceae bacterium]
MAQKTKAKAGKSTRKKSTKRPVRKTAKRPARQPAPAVSIPTVKAQFLESFQREHAITAKVLRALPTDQTEFRPHIRLRSARELAFTFVMEQNLLTKALTGQPFFGGPPTEPPPSYRDVVDQFERDYVALVDLIRSSPDSKFQETLSFPTGPQQMGEWRVSQFMWFILGDQIHHRGQFSIYLRLTGGKVPSIYGPSADEPWR